MHVRFVIILLAFLLIGSLAALPALAAQEEADRPASEDPPAAPAAQPQTDPVGADDVLAMADQPPHWFNFFWRGGLGLDSTSVGIKYRDVDGGGEDAFSASGSGLADTHLFSFWFYPTPDRRFLLNFGFGGGSGNGQFSSDSDDSRFLDKKEYWYYQWLLPLGIGYRWLLGDNDRVSLDLYGEGHWSYNALFFEGAKDGIELNGGGAGIVFGAHYRYENGFLWGGLAEARFNAAAKQDSEILGELVDVDFSGFALYLTMVLGYEPR